LPKGPWKTDIEPVPSKGSLEGAAVRETTQSDPILVNRFPTGSDDSDFSLNDDIVENMAGSGSLSQEKSNEKQGSSVPNRKSSASSFMSSSFKSMRGLSPPRSLRSLRRHFSQGSRLQLHSEGFLVNHGENLTASNVFSYCVAGSLKKDEDRIAIALGGLELGGNGSLEDLIDSKLSASKLSIFSVIDGHGGPGCADFLQSNLTDRIKHHFATKCSQGETSLGLGAVLTACVSEAICSVDADFTKYAESVNDYSGACFVVALCYSNTICFANVGDCLGVLYNSTGKIKLPSQVHRCTIQKEIQRITKAGAPLRDGRLGGLLVPSRSVGDLDVRLAYPGAVVAEPYVAVLELEVGQGSSHRRPFLLLASDGIWDSMQTTAAAKHVKRTLKEKGWDLGAFHSDEGIELTPDPAKSLVEAAKKLGSVDDIAAVVVVF